MSDNQGYNGWANYETWSVALILGNEEGTYLEVRTIVGDAIEQAELPDYLKDVQTPERWAILNAADAVEEYVRDMIEGLDNDGTAALLTQQLVGAALSEVVWPDVAESFAPEDGEDGSTSAAFAAALLALVPVGLALTFVARLAGAVAGVA